MNTTAVYTPLERLLLFQSLVAFGTEEEDFSRISELLTNNLLVKDAPTYDAQRLGSEALRNQYLQLLRDELKAEEQDGSEESSSKKRKIPTPPLPSIKDAREYRDKLPSLVDHLYARYRDNMVREIRDEEKRYAAIQKDIEEIKRGEWDERLRDAGALGNGNGNTTAPSVQPLKNGISTDPVRQGDVREAPKQTTPRISPVPPQRPDHMPLPNNQQQPHFPPPRIQDQIRPPLGFPPPPNHQRTPGAGPQSPHAGPQPGNFIWEPPLTAPNQLSPYQPPPQGYPQYNQGQYPPQQGYAPPPRGSFSQNGMSPHPPQSTVPSSPGHQQQQHPALLPPPQGGVRRPPSAQGVPLDALADAASNQYRAPSGSPVFPQHVQQHGPHNPQHPPPPHLPSQQGALQHPQNAQQYHSQHAQQYHGPPPQGYAQPYPPQQRSSSANGLPPYAPQYASPQPQYQVPQGQRPPLPFQPPQQAQYSSPYNSSQGPRPPIQPNQTPRYPPNYNPSTPASQGSARTHNTGLGTKWTPVPSVGTPGGSVKLAPPEFEKIPETDLVPKPRPVAGTPTITKPKRGRPKGSRGGGQAGSGPARGTQRTRAGSVASSVVAGSHRSQSIMSHADELSLDAEVKEEVATPIGDDAGDTTADESTLPRHKPTLPSPRQSTKRKRALSNAVEPRPPAGPPTQVLWTRNFPKISIPALENIAATKSASMFAIPVKEKDAPGYSELVLRPQDLKSIRSAITAGNRAAIAAAPADMKSDATSVWLPISEDLVPPKGIINYSQLEKELMRMFANAIMFNPDPDRGFGPKWSAAMASSTGGVLGYAVDEDSVVKGTRAMFADVEKAVGDLRVAERKSEENTRESSVVKGAEDDEDELAGDGENRAAQTGSVAKRRRKV